MDNWHNCSPGNMPEDIYPITNAKEIVKNGNLFFGPFLGVNTFESTESYFICSRYKRKGQDRWTWSGHHPLAWREIPKYTSNSKNVTY